MDPENQAANMEVKKEPSLGQGLSSWTTAGNGYGTKPHKEILLEG